MKRTTTFRMNGMLVRFLEILMLLSFGSCSDAGGEKEGIPDAGPDADTDTDANRYTDADTDTYAATDTGTDTATDTDTDTASDSDTVADIDTDTDTGGEGGADTDIAIGTVSDQDAGTDTDADGGDAADDGSDPPRVGAPYAHFGVDVESAGDVNGDGFGDVIVGASGYNGGQGRDQGRVYVYYGAAGGLDTIPDWTYTADRTPTIFGTAVGGAGDVNGDGYDDIVVGAPRFNDGIGANQGRVFVFYGSAAGLSAAPDWMVTSDQDPGDFGYSVAGAGDVNNDGYADVIVGCPSYTVDETWEGRVFVYPGSASGLSDTPWTLDGNNPYSRFGASVGTAGDVNNDGYADIIIGAFQYQYPPSRGGAFVHYGSAAGIETTAAWSVMGAQNEARYGHPVVGLGDINNDGYDDVALGETMYDDTLNADSGRVHVFLSSAAGLSATPDWELTGEQASEGLGQVAPAGDVNQDGFADLFVGGAGYSPGDPAGLSNAGRARIFLGSATGLQAMAIWTTLGDKADGRYGASGALAGDVNGDGFDELLVGAYYYEDAAEEEGRAYMYCGAAGGLPSTPCWVAGP